MYICYKLIYLAPKVNMMVYNYNIYHLIAPITIVSVWTSSIFVRVLELAIYGSVRNLNNRKKLCIKSYFLERYKFAEK